VASRLPVEHETQRGKADRLYLSRVRNNHCFRARSIIKRHSHLLKADHELASATLFVGRKMSAVAHKHSISGDSPGIATPAANASFAFPSTAPSDEVCRRAVQCIGSFNPVMTARLVTRKAGTDLIVPKDSVDAFSLGHLEAFFAVKRSCAAEFSPDLLCRMVSHLCPNHLVDAVSLRAGASSGPYQADWQQVLLLTQQHAQRAHSARTHHAEARRRTGVVPAPPDLTQTNCWATLSPRAMTARARTNDSASTPRVAALTSGTGNESSARPTTAAIPAIAAVSALSPQPPSPRAHAPDGKLSAASGRRGQQGKQWRVRRKGSHAAGADSARLNDEYRDEHGRRRLYLPVLEHPPWSQHVGDVYNDCFDELRKDATGRTITEFNAHPPPPLLLSTRSTATAASSRRGIVDCGMTMTMGLRHQMVSRGALVVDLTKVHGSTFNPYFSEHTQGHKRLPIAEAMRSRVTAVPQTVRRSGGAVAGRRIDDSITRVVAYLDDVC
jgi:hypothetical protein